MIRRAIVASTAVLFMALALPLTANAQSVFVLAGLSSPSSDYGDDFAETGWLAAVGVTFPVGESGLWAGAEGLYGQNGIQDTDENGKIFSAMGIVGYDIPTESTVAPYVFGGAGLLSLSFSVEDADSESGFGWQLGAGVGFQGESNITPFVEARYESASLDGGTLAIFGVEAGVSIGLGGDN